MERCRDGAGRPGTVAAVAAQAVGDLEAIRPEGAAPEERVFPLSLSTISRRLADAARAVELDSGFSGHSGRVGLARATSAREAPDSVIVRQGRWRPGRMVARYTRGEAASATLAYLNEDAGG